MSLYNHRSTCRHPAAASALTTVALFAALAGHALLTPSIAHAQCSGTVIFTDDMESGTNGWSTYRYMISSPTFCTENEWHIDDTASSSGSMSWSNVPYREAGGADPTSACYNYVQSPTFVVPAETEELWVSFSHRHNAEEGDDGEVQISTNGLDWTPVSTEYSGVSQPGNGLDFNDVTLDLTGTFVPGGDYRIRFQFFSDQLVGGIGWNVDDVSVEACVLAVPADRGSWGRVKAVYRQ